MSACRNAPAQPALGEALGARRRPRRTRRRRGSARAAATSAEQLERRHAGAAAGVEQQRPLAVLGQPRRRARRRRSARSASAASAPAMAGELERVALLPLEAERRPRSGPAPPTASCRAARNAVAAATKPASPSSTAAPSATVDAEQLPEPVRQRRAGSGAQMRGGARRHRRSRRRSCGCAAGSPSCWRRSRARRGSRPAARPKRSR